MPDVVVVVGDGSGGTLQRQVLVVLVMVGILCSGGSVGDGWDNDHEPVHVVLQVYGSNERSLYLSR